MGRTSTGAGLAHEKLLAVGYRVAILVVSTILASGLFSRRTAA